MIQYYYAWRTRIIAQLLFSIILFMLYNNLIYLKFIKAKKDEKIIQLDIYYDHHSSECLGNSVHNPLFYL